MKLTAMANGTFRLKGRRLFEEIGKARGVKNIHQASKRSDISYPTLYRYVNNSGELHQIELRSLTSYLVDTLGLTPEEVADLKFGDVFEYVPDQEVVAE